MEEELLAFEKLVRRAATFKPELIEKARRGDLKALADYTDQLGAALSRSTREVLATEAFKNLPDVQKGRVVREVLGEGTLVASRVSSTVAHETMTSVLREKGVALAAAFADPAEERMKGIVAGSLEHYFNKGNPEAAANLLDSGFRQVVDSSARSTIVNTSEMLFLATGKRLKAKRIVRGSRACEYCRSMAWLDGPIYTSSERVHFHDNCSCYFQVI